MRKELASIAAAFILSINLPTRAQELPSPTNAEIIEETLLLQMQLQEKYDVEIYNNITRWDRDRLLMLDRFLSFLPPGLYSPTEEGRKARFELTPFIYRATPGHCACGHIAGKEDADVILFTTSSFNPIRLERSLRTTVHELVHRRMPTVALTDEPSLTDPHSYTSPWYETINTILGGEFGQIRHEIYRKVLGKFPSIVETLEDAELIAWMYGVIYAVGKDPLSPQPPQSFDHPIELVAVLGEHFVAGRNYFFHMYRHIFDEKTVVQLYNFIRDEVFDGWEYENFAPLIVTTRTPTPRGAGVSAT